MRAFLSLILTICLSALTACHQEEMFDCFDGPHADGYCDCGEYCWDDDPWDPDPDDRPPDGYGWCDSTEDCGPDEICAPFGQCMALVLDCPLTEECLPDPEGYVPDWMGIDPTYVGEFEVEDSQVRLIVNLDFYEDHLYGEGFAEIWSEYGWWEGYNFAVTGSRDGAQLWGQVIETDGFGRTFDLTFEAQLLSASEIVGTFSLSGDEGQVDGAFTIFRTSPCGCEETPCQEDADCPEGQVCQDGECVNGQEQPCTENADCEPGQVCLDGECIEICLDDSDCPEGQVCVDHLCVDDEVPPVDCVEDGDCPEGQVCVDNVCVDGDVPPIECCDDSDCAEGEVCVDNQCVPVCEFDCCADSDCAEGEQCVEGECVAVCDQECCQDADCPEGDECVDGVCLTPCELNCQCEAGEICQDGYCIIPDEDPPPDCETDCDCDYAAGERCIDGICQIP